MGRTSLQDRCIDEQLSMGIRYFDLRIAHKPSDPSCDLYFTHIIYTHLTVMVSTLVFMWGSTLVSSRSVSHCCRPSFTGYVGVCCRLVGVPPEGDRHPRLQPFWGNGRRCPPSLHFLFEAALRLKTLSTDGTFSHCAAGGWGGKKHNLLGDLFGLHRNRPWPCGVCGHLVTRSSCRMTRRVQRDTRSCGPLCPTGGPTNAPHREWSVTWTAKKTRAVQVEFLF